MLGSSPYQRFNTAVAAQPAAAASPLSMGAPAVTTQAAAPTTAAPAVAQTGSAIQTAAPPPVTNPVQPGDWRSQVNAWRDSRPQRPEDFDGKWRRSDEFQAWRDARPQRPNGWHGGDGHPGMNNGQSGRPDWHDRPHGPGMGQGWGAAGPSPMGINKGPMPGPGNRPDISGFLASLRGRYGNQQS